MQAIETTYSGATDTRGARVIARSQARRISIPWDDGLNQEDNHAKACKLLAGKLEWFGMWAEGGKADGKGNVYVCIERYKSLQDVDIKRV